MPRRYVYLNYAQQELYLTSPRDVRGSYPRRTGKTKGMLGPYMHRVQRSMPLGDGIFLGCNRKQLLSRTVPAVAESWTSLFGLKEGQNFCYGKPPAKLNYPSPIYKPKDFSNTMSFANGFYWTLATLAATASVNGITSSSICGDEAKFWQYDKLVGEVLPCNSGNIVPLNDAFTNANPYYRSTCFVSDASLSSRMGWLEKEEAKMDLPIESGPNKGKTSRQLQAELLDYARQVIDINEITYAAKKNKRQVLVKPESTIAYARELRELCRQRKGKFHILPNGDNSEANCRVLVEYKVLSPEDAELLYNADYLMTEEQFIYMKIVQNDKKYQSHLRQIRCDCFGYYSGSTIDNVALLSEDYIRKMKVSLPPLVFAISILGIKMKHTSEGFYYALDIENTHGYIDNEDNGIIDNSTRTRRVSRVYNGATYTGETESPDFDYLGSINDCQLDGDLLPDDDLFIAADYNARINWFVIGVVHRDPESNRDTLFVINSMFVKTPQFIEDLVEQFNRYYAPHRRRHNRLVYFYDSTAKRNEAYASRSHKDFYTIISEGLARGGWDVQTRYMGNPADHAIKYREINQGLAGLGFPAVRINREKNEALIVALENAGVVQGYNGFHKDKSGEKLPYNPDLDDGSGSGGKLSSTGRPTNVPEEYRTDGTDAFDTLYEGIKHFRFGGGSVFSGF